MIETTDLELTYPNGTEERQPRKPEAEIHFELYEVLRFMTEYKPNDRSEQDRHWAIAITDLEKVIAWWGYNVLQVSLQPQKERDG